MREKYVKNMMFAVASVFLIFSASMVYPSSGKNVYTSKSRKKIQPWTLEEEQTLCNLVKQYGTKNWNLIALQLPGYTHRQCREHWLNVLSPYINRNPWTEEEDDFIINFIEKNGPMWTQCTTKLLGRTTTNIRRHWRILLRNQKNLKKYGTIDDAKNTPSKQQENQGMHILPRKRYWSPEEDDLLSDAVKQIGAQNWNRIALLVGSRNAKQCRDRWLEHLNPTVKHGDWSEEENQLLVMLHQIHGNKWAKISREFSNRTDAEIKNRWNNVLSKNYSFSKSQEIPTQKSQATASNFNFFDYPFDIENEDWFPPMKWAK